MKKLDFWRSDWFLGVVVALVVLVLVGPRPDPEPGAQGLRPGRAGNVARAVGQDRRHRHRRAEHRQHRPLAVVARSARQDDRHAGRRQGQGHRQHHVLLRAADRSRARLHQQAARALQERTAGATGRIRRRLGCDPRIRADGRAARRGRAGAQHRPQAGRELHESGQRRCCRCVFQAARRAARQAGQAAAPITSLDNSLPMPKGGERSAATGRVPDITR